MTSSLVGSEMCIRDRPREPSPRHRGGNKLFAILGRYHRKPRRGVELSVSYTHLTLPTICSV
eukprot:627253-Prorocentrum_lima.AAC.1